MKRIMNMNVARDVNTIIIRCIKPETTCFAWCSILFVSFYVFYMFSSWLFEMWSRTCSSFLNWVWNPLANSFIPYAICSMSSCILFESSSSFYFWASKSTAFVGPFFPDFFFWDSKSSKSIHPESTICPSTYLSTTWRKTHCFSLVFACLFSL